MKRVVHIAKNHADAKQWDIKQVLSMSVVQRQAVAKT